ncbi:MAG: YrhK family protein [Sciscionella sp.]
MSETQSGAPLIVHIGHEELVIRQRYEVASIVNDVLIAVWFAIGSIFFFFEALTFTGTCLFLLGSAQLLIRPVIRLRRLVHLKRIGAEPAPTTDSPDM